MIGASVSVSNHYVLADGRLVNCWGRMVDSHRTVSRTSSLDRSLRLIVLFAGGLFSGYWRWRGCLFVSMQQVPRVSASVWMLSLSVTFIAHVRYTLRPYASGVCLSLRVTQLVNTDWSIVGYYRELKIALRLVEFHRADSETCWQVIYSIITTQLL